MSKHLERDLAKLHADIMVQAEAVDQAIRGAIAALRERSAAQAQKVIEGESNIDARENEVEEECLKILALHQPVAADLRRIAAVLKMNTDLERMADLAVDIAERAARLTELPPAPVPDRLEEMSALTTQMVRQSLEAFMHMDVAMARQVCRMDDEVDRRNAEIIQELVALMRGSADKIEAGLSLFSATRHLERIADHATNIAEDVIYLVRGEIVRHHPEAIED